MGEKISKARMIVFKSSMPKNIFGHRLAFKLKHLKNQN